MSSVRAGDEVFILTRDGTCIGVGRAKVDAATARAMEKGSIVRTRRNIASQVVPGRATWDDAVRANADVLERAEGSSVLFVQEVADRNPHLARNVSYSGGKDSLATLLVVTKAIGKVPMLFADTGLEFPETYENIAEASRRYGLEVIRTDGNTTFWKTFEEQGPPGGQCPVVLQGLQADPGRGPDPGAVGRVPLVHRPAAVRVGRPGPERTGLAEQERAGPALRSPDP